MVTHHDRWAVVAASAIGSAHLADDRPNQDALATFETDRGLVVAIADGHGGRRYVRSSDGSRLAVEVARRLGAEALDASRALIDSARELPARIVSAWRSEVVADLTARPLSADAAALVGPDPLVAYGATLVVLLLRGAEAVALQIGDGDVVAAWPDGSVSRPVPDDPRNVGGQTTSLCLGDAAQAFRVAHLGRGDDVPALVLAASDGYGNSFADAQWSSRVPREVLDRRQSMGDSALGDAVAGWARDSAEVGGDDTTVAFAFPPTVPSPIASSPRASRPTLAPPMSPARAPGPPDTRNQVAGRARGIVLALIALALATAAFVAGRASAGSSSPSGTVPSAPPASPGDSAFDSGTTEPPAPTVTRAPDTFPPATSAPGNQDPPLLPSGSEPINVALTDARVRVLASAAIAVDVDLSTQPPRGAAVPIEAPGGPVRSVASVSGWWSVTAGGTLELRSLGSDAAVRAIPLPDGAGPVLGLGASAGCVIAVTGDVAGDMRVLLFDAVTAAQVDDVAVDAVGAGRRDPPQTTSGDPRPGTGQTTEQGAQA
jgi:hypothetical protein